MSLSAGTRLGGYEVLAPLGAGGMGEVYRARDPKLGREVAIKVLPEALAKDPDALARFEREARAVAALSHPNILSIHELGTSDGVVFIVLELLEGETLRSRLIHGPLPPKKAVEISAQVARALAAAHDRGVVHRDLKPENLFLTSASVVKVLDFGLAKAARLPAAGDSVSPTLAQETEPGTVLGTVGYMAPEQVRGLAADHRSDIFSLGCVMHEMLAGSRAFRGASAVETMSAILKEDAPEPPAATPPALAQIVHHCLEKRPEERFQSARDLAFALESLSQSSATGRAAALDAGGAARRRRLLPWLAAAGALFAGVLGGRVLTRAPAVGKPLVRFAIAPEHGAPFNGMLALSPDGSRLAFVASGADGNDRLWLRSFASLEARPVSGTEGATYPFFSPDGRQVGFFANGSLKTLDIASGGIQTLCSARDARGGSWSREGFILFAPRDGAEIDRVPVSGGEPKRVFALSAERHEASQRWPSVLPDGKHFTYLSLGDVGKQAIYVGNVDSSETRFVTRGDSAAQYAAGSIVYSSAGRLVRQPFDLGGLKAAGPAQPLAEDVFWDAFASGYFGYSVSENGTLAYMAGGIAKSRLSWYDRAGRPLGPIGPAAPIFEPALSPDERRLALSTVESETIHSNIWVLDLARGGLGRLTEAAVAVTPVFSPDGRRIAYSTYPAGVVFTRDASGTGESQKLFEAGTFCVLEDWTPDGRLFFTKLDLAAFRYQVFVIPANGGKPEPVLTGTANMQGARLSPDGRWLAYVSDESGHDEIYVRSYPQAGERFAISSGGGFEPFWRADGKELFYVTPDRKLMSVSISSSPRFEPGKPEVLFQSRILPFIEARNHYVVTKDGQRFLVNERLESDASRPLVVALNALAEESPR